VAEFKKIDDVLYEFNGEEKCIEEKAIAYLLNADVLFVCAQEWIAPYDDIENTIAIAVNCNDVFAWACADDECLPLDQIIPLYKAHIKDPRWGSDIWCCFRRNLQPQCPVIDGMKKDGVWTDDLEALPVNPDTLEGTE